MLRIGEPGQPTDTTRSSADASPVHPHGETEKTEGPNLPARALGNGTNQGHSADRTAASARSTSLRFILVAVLSLIELAYYRTGNPDIAYLAGATGLLFVALALKGSKIQMRGLLGALLLYGVSTTAMAVLAMTTEQGIELVLKPLALHAVLMISLYRNFEARENLQLVENRH